MVKSCLLTLGLALSPAVFGKVHLKELFNYYPVAGKSITQLSLSLKHHSPIKPYIGRATTRTSFEGKTRQRNNICYLEKVNVVLNVVYTMPKIVKYTAATKSRFDTMYANLLRHEKNHAEISLKYARLIDRQLRDIKPQRNCAKIQEKVNYILSKNGALERKENAEYDLRTHHGIKEGVRLD